MGFRKRKGIRDKEQERIWRKNHNAIYRAIRVLEKEDPFKPVTVSRIKKMLKEQISRQTIHKHLDEMITRGRLYNISRGAYSSDMATVARSFTQELIGRETYETVPKMGEIRFNEILSRSLSLTMKKEEELSKKAHIPFFGWLFRSKWRDIRILEYMAEDVRRKEMEEDLSLIEQATEIRIFSSKKMGSFIMEKLREVIATFLYDVLNRERTNRISWEDMKGAGTDKEKERAFLEKWQKFRADKKLLKDCSLNIIIKFNPITD